MMIYLKKYRFHLLIWAVMLCYLAAAPALYAEFILRNGKPVSLNQELPEPTTEALGEANRLDPTSLNGQNQYNLWGWAFIKGEEDQTIYERFVVLRSNTRTYFFSTEIISFPQVQTLFPYLDQDVTETGFSTYLAKEAIARGTYRVGFLFRHKSTADAFYIETNKVMVKTANQLKLTIP